MRRCAITLKVPSCIFATLASLRARLTKLHCVTAPCPNNTLPSTYRLSVPQATEPLNCVWRSSMRTTVIAVSSATGIVGRVAPRKYWEDSFTSTGPHNAQRNRRVPSVFTAKTGRPSQPRWVQKATPCATLQTHRCELPACRRKTYHHQMGEHPKPR